MRRALLLLLVLAGCGGPTFKDGVAAVRKDDAEALARMLARDKGLVAATGPDGHVLLHYAAGTGAARSARVLIEAGSEIGAVVKKTGQTSLHVASTATVARVLLDHGAGVNTEDAGGWTPLRSAAFNDHLDVAQLVLAHGARPLAPARDGTIPLHDAAAIGSYAMLEALVATATTVRVRREADGATPLHVAASEGRASAVALLLSKGADPAARSKNGWTSLHFAASAGHAEVAARLLAGGAKPDAEKDDGWTPLHNAAHHGHRAVIEHLLRAGARRDAKNGEGKTPLEVATPEVRDLLGP